MTVTVEELRALWHTAMETEYAMKVAAKEYELASMRAHAERRVIAGHKIDMWGDGRVKPEAECKSPPMGGDS